MLLLSLFVVRSFRMRFASMMFLVRSLAHADWRYAGPERVLSALLLLLSILAMLTPFPIENPKCVRYQNASSFFICHNIFFSDLVLSFMLHRLPAHKALQNCSMLQWHFMAMISTCYTYVRRLCFAYQVETTSRAYLLLRYTQRMKWSRRRRCHFACGRRPHQKFRSQLKLTYYFA